MQLRALFQRQLVIKTASLAEAYTGHFDRIASLKWSVDQKSFAW